MKLLTFGSNCHQNNISIWHVLTSAYDSSPGVAVSQLNRIGNELLAIEHPGNNKYAFIFFPPITL